jgi:hypothetical protein
VPFSVFGDRLRFTELAFFRPIGLCGCGGVSLFPMAFIGMTTNLGIPGMLAGERTNNRFNGTLWLKYITRKRLVDMQSQAKR